MKIKDLKYFVVFLIIISCNELSRENEFYSSGNIKTIHEYKGNQLLKSTFYYDNNEVKHKELFYKSKYDSLVYYYDNGNVFKKGKKNKEGLHFGIWNYYTREGYLSNSEEFLLINNSWSKGNWLNQSVYLNKKGDTMYYGNNKFNIYDQEEFKKESEGEKTSFFVRFHKNNISDTISISEPFSSIAEDGFPMWEKANSESYIVLAKEKYNFNSDFSNENTVKLDTFICLEKDKFNQEILPNVNKKHTVVFGRWFDTPGKKYLRGYMVEHYKRKATPNDSVRGETRRTYFEKIIYVKDTIN